MITWRLICLAIISVALSATAQLAFKFGMMHAKVQAVLGSDAGLWVRAVAVLGNPSVMAGFALYGLSAVLWLLVLARMDVSIAYPFVGLGFIVTMLCGALLFGEQVTALRIAGTALVCVGVVLVARSS